MNSYNEIIEDLDFDQRIKRKYRNKTLNVPNTLIKSGKKSNLLMEKIDLLSHYKLVNEPTTVIKDDGLGNKYEVYTTSINMREIMELMPRKGNSLYDSVDKLQIAMAKRLFIYRDPETKRFVVKPLYLTLDYDQGILNIQYNPDTLDVFLNLAHGYTRLLLYTAMRLTTTGGFQLYKILSEYLYQLPKVDLDKPQNEQEYLIQEFNYDDFRIMMGVIDLNNDELSSELIKKSPNSELLNKLDKSAKYKRWADFYNSLILVGIKEINAKTDLYIDTNEEIKISGAHNKTIAVKFKIMHNVEYYKNKQENPSDDEDKKRELSSEELDLFLDQIRDIAPCKMSTKDLKAIALAAEYNYEKLNDVFDYVRDNLNKIDNPVGATIDRLKHNNYDYKKKKNAKWAQMELSSYKNVNWDEFEANIVSN